MKDEGKEGMIVSADAHTDDDEECSQSVIAQSKEEWTICIACWESDAGQLLSRPKKWS